MLQVVLAPDVAADHGSSDAVLSLLNPSAYTSQVSEASLERKLLVHVKRSDVSALEELFKSNPDAFRAMLRITVDGKSCIAYAVENSLTSLANFCCDCF